MRTILTKKERCQARVAPPGMWGSFQQHQCGKKAIVTCDGVQYCKIHSPEYIKAKREAIRKRFDHATSITRIQFSGHNLLAACKKALEANHNPIVEKILIEAIKKAEGA